MSAQPDFLNYAGDIFHECCIAAMVIGEVDGLIGICASKEETMASNCRMRFALHLCCWLLVMVSPPSLSGLDREVQISQMHHTSWTDENAGLGAIRELVQTSDGFLWLRTSDNRLLRFDGVRFEPIEATLVGIVPTGPQRWEDISGMQPALGGGLWIAHVGPYVDLVKDGVSQTFSTQPCITTAHATGFAQEKKDVVWIKTTEGLARLQNGHCVSIGKDWGYSGNYPVALLMDRQGTLWVKDSAGQLLFLPRGSRHFEVNVSGAGVPAADGHLVQAPDGSIWQSSPYGLQKIIQDWHGRPAGPAPVLGPYSEVAKFLFDREGALWFEAVGGIYRIVHPDKLVPWHPKAGDYVKGRPALRPEKAHAILQTFSTDQGLSSDQVDGLIEGREGEIWAATADGLDQFRDNSLVKALLPRTPVQQFTLSGGSAGSVWTGNWNSPVFHVEKSALSTLRIGGENITTLYSDPEGTTWVGTPDSVWRSTTEGFKRAGKNPAAGPDYVLAMSTDPGGGLWVSLFRSGVFLLNNSVWTKENDRLNIRTASSIYAIATDSHGKVWFNSGTITIVDGGHVQTIKMPGGYATSMNVTGPHTWVGGLHGLGLLTGGKFQVIHGLNDDSFKGVTGIIECPNGDIWINSIAGVIRFPAAEISKAIRDSQYQVKYRLFDASDGLEGKANTWLPVPTATVASDGSLWFATNKGVFRADPESMKKQPEPAPPQVFFTSLVANGKRNPASDNLRLPPHTQNVQIAYTTPNFVTPERLSFHYQLQNADRKWQDAGNRREAFYTNLSPGHYRFLVNASNGSEPPGAVAEFSFVIDPAWYQTIWFECLCVLAAIAALWGLYTLRLKQVSARFDERMGERLRERERIARELHDTLLQSIHGLLIRLQAVVGLIPDNLQVRGMMETTIAHTDDVLVQARERVRDLRSHHDTEDDLVERMTKLLNEFREPDGPDLSILVLGTPFPTRPAIAEEVALIGREAIANALQHSKCHKVSCELRFEQHQVIYAIEDDGIGIDNSVLVAGRQGHWGLVGMRERATRISSILTVSSKGTGARVELRIPRRIINDPSTAKRKDKGKSWFERLKDRV